MPILGHKAWFTSMSPGRFGPISWEGWLTVALCIIAALLVRKFVEKGTLQAALIVAVITITVVVAYLKTG